MIWEVYGKIGKIFRGRKVRIEQKLEETKTLRFNKGEGIKRNIRCGQEGE